jgi:hypothetical protein
MSEALGLKIQKENFGIYQERLDSLRRGEAGEKIRCGLGMAQIKDWGMNNEHEKYTIAESLPKPARSCPFPLKSCGKRKRVAL